MKDSIADPTNPSSLSHYFRAKRAKILKSYMLGVPRQKGQALRVADIGGDAAFWQNFGLEWLQANEIEVTCINKEYSELGRDRNEFANVRLQVGDACNLKDIADNGFDLAHSNSVIEHVGVWSKIEAFAHEVQRVAPAHFVQTPYFWFPIDPHFHRAPFIHWLPPSLRARIHSRFRLGWGGSAKSVGHSMELALSNSMLDQRQFRALFPCSEHILERAFGLPKSMIAIGNERHCQTHDKLAS